MIQIGKLISRFSKIKPLKLTAESLPEGIKFTSQTHDETWESHHPLEAMLGSLAACELATLRTYTSRGPLKVNHVKFTRIESSYSAEKFLKGGPENKMDDIFIEAEVHTNGTQADLDAVHEKVTNSCPVYQTFKAAGVNIHNTWKNIQTSE